MEAIASITQLEQPRLARLFRLQWEPSQDAYVLLYPEGMVKLNRSAAEILQRCDGLRRVPDIVAQLETAFGASGLAADVQAFMADARQRGWLV
jgi:pyrroloquinoline quinone biosynthesis protein D